MKFSNLIGNETISFKYKDLGDVEHKEFDNSFLDFAKINCGVCQLEPSFVEFCDISLDLLESVCQQINLALFFKYRVGSIKAEIDNELGKTTVYLYIHTTKRERILADLQAIIENPNIETKVLQTALTSFKKNLDKINEYKSIV